MNLKDFSYALYLCKWTDAEVDRAKPHRNAGKEIVQFVFTFISALTCLFTFYIVASLRNDFDRINWFILAKTGTYFHWYSTIFITSLIFMLYACFVFFSGLNAPWKKQHVTLSWINFIVLILFIGAGIVVLVLLCNSYPAWRIVANLSYNGLGPFLHILGYIIWVCLLHYVAKLVSSGASVGLKLIVILTYSIVFVLLCFVPFLLSCPCITNNSTQMKKPRLIGHRGAPSLAPENTIMSFQKAIGCSVLVIESDVRISLDGVPFLMHDDTLLRTTDVSTLYPSRKNHRAESFLWAEIQKLSAGKWFLDTNPTLSSQYLSSSDKTESSNQAVPSLDEYVTIAKLHNKSILFDLVRPPEGHPHRHNWVNITVGAILNTNISQEQVLWLYTDSSRSIVKELAPNFTLISPSYVNNASELGIKGYNVMYTDIINVGKLYTLPVISYVINEEWLFSWAWCQGVWAVTTNYPCKLNAMDRPVYTMTKTGYIAMWVIIELFAIISIAIYVWKCKRFIDSGLKYELTAGIS